MKQSSLARSKSPEARQKRRSLSIADVHKNFRLSTGQLNTRGLKKSTDGINEDDKHHTIIHKPVGRSSSLSGAPHSPRGEAYKKHTEKKRNTESPERAFLVDTSKIKEPLEKTNTDHQHAVKTSKRGKAFPRSRSTGNVKTALRRSVVHPSSSPASSTVSIFFLPR